METCSPEGWVPSEAPTQSGAGSCENPSQTGRTPAYQGPEPELASLHTSGRFSFVLRRQTLLWQCSSMCRRMWTQSFL